MDVGAVDPPHMDLVVPITEARATLSDLLVEAGEHEVDILRHGRPAGVLLSVEAYERAMARIEDLDDMVATLQARAEGDVEPFERSTPSTV